MIIIVSNFQNNVAQNNKKFVVNNLESNQPYPDLGVAFFDDDFVVFSAQIKKPLGLHSRKRRRNTKKNITLLPQNLDFYFTPIDKNGNFINNQKLNNVINSGYDDYGLAFSKDQSVVYFSREMIAKDSEEMRMELFQAKVISPGSWVNIRKLSINHPKYSVGYPCLSEDDKTLYYVSNEEGNFNIYKVAVERNGDIGGLPIKLSSDINSSSNEITPFVINNKLYFSSDKSGGLGGYDIYFTDLIDGNSKVLRIDEPINSPFDDFNFIKNNSNQGFFVSNRLGGKGKEDIYSFKEKVKEEDNLASSIIKTKANKIFEDEEEKMLASKKVNKSKVNLSVEKRLKSEKVKSGEVVDKTSTDKEIITYVKNDTVFDYQRRNSYDIQKQNIEVEGEANTSFGKIDKSKNEYNKCQMEFDKVNNIYFDYSESYIREDAAIELDKVIRVMRLCPKIVLQASSHTDSRASNSYNLKLSQSRANSVVKYILRNGHFSPDRIVSKGYGEERLVNKCSDGVKCTEKEHQLNRRTHFEIFNY